MTLTGSVLNHKGGAGKTTNAANLAHAKVAAARSCCPSISTEGLAPRLERGSTAAPLVPVVGLDRESLAADLPAVTGGYDCAVIDGAPRSTSWPRRPA